MTRIPLTEFTAPATLTLMLHEAIIEYFRRQGNHERACEQILSALVALARDYERAGDPRFRWKLVRKLTEVQS